MRENQKRRMGFTLIELLIVVAIIAILAAIAVPNFIEAQTRSKVSRTKADLRSLATAMETYRVDNASYVPDFDGWNPRYNTIPWDEVGTSFSFMILTTPIAYIADIPGDVFNQGGEYGVPGDFQYYASDTWAIVSTSRATNWKRLGLKWMIGSLGPDLMLGGMMDSDKWTVMNGSEWELVNAVYDASNGTVSGGDIARSNLGAHPE